MVSDKVLNGKPYNKQLCEINSSAKLLASVTFKVIKTHSLKNKANETKTMLILNPGVFFFLSLQDEAHIEMIQMDQPLWPIEV